MYGESKKAKSDEGSGDETEDENDSRSMARSGGKAVNDDENMDEVNDVEPKDDEDLMLRINQIISDARFVGVTADMCEIPSTLLVNRDIVAGLKDSLMAHPDKCQCLVGVVEILDNKVDQKRIGRYQVFVNPELFVALQELSFEGIDFYGEDRLPAVVHSVTEDDDGITR